MAPNQAGTEVFGADANAGFDIPLKPDVVLELRTSQ